jgi:hypothetical protein
MATVGLPVDATTDVGAIWKEAIDRYEDITKVKIESMARARNVDEVLRETRDRDTKFRAFRHDETKMDNFRTLVSRSLGPIEKVGSMVASAASASFPPTIVVFTVVTYLIKTANSVSADYDKIIGFFEELDSYLDRLKILEGNIPPELTIALARVLTSVLILCGISAKYIKTKRLVKAVQNLVTGEDDELSAAYAHFHKMVDQETGAVRNATLAGVEQLKKDGTATHADVKLGLVIANRNEQNTETIMITTSRMDENLEVWHFFIQIPGF